MKTKPQISCTVTAQLIGAFVFATQIVQVLYLLNQKFQDSSYLLWLYSPVCVGPGPNSRRPVFSERGLIYFLEVYAQLISNVISYIHVYSFLSRHTCNFTHNLSKVTDQPLHLNVNSVHLSSVMRKPTFWFTTWSDTNQAVQLQKMVRDLKFRI